MKTFKNLFKIFLSLLFAIPIFSCGSDDPGGSNTSRIPVREFSLEDYCASEPGGNGKIFDADDGGIALIIYSEPGGNGKTIPAELTFDMKAEDIRCEFYGPKFLLVLEIAPNTMVPDAEYIVENPCLGERISGYSKEDGSFHAEIEVMEGQYVLIYPFEAQEEVLFIGPIRVDY